MIVSRLLVCSFLYIFILPLSLDLSLSLSHTLFVCVYPSDADIYHAKEYIICRLFNGLDTYIKSPIINFKFFNVYVFILFKIRHGVLSSAFSNKFQYIYWMNNVIVSWEINKFNILYKSQPVQRLKNEKAKKKKNLCVNFVRGEGSLCYNIRLFAI